jgi:hypothetical protein
MAKEATKADFEYHIGVVDGQGGTLHIPPLPPN